MTVRPATLPRTVVQGLIHEVGHVLAILLNAFRLFTTDSDDLLPADKPEMVREQVNDKETSMDMQDRSDNNLELAVRYGIVLDHTLGAVHAWTFMANQGVDRAVILRVLTEEKARRATDQLAIELAVKHGRENLTVTAKNAVSIF